jgi:hypothetical protein
MSQQRKTFTEELINTVFEEALEAKDVYNLIRLNIPETFVFTMESCSIFILFVLGRYQPGWNPLNAEAVNYIKTLNWGYNFSRHINENVVAYWVSNDTKIANGYDTVAWKEPELNSTVVPIDEERLRVTEGYGHLMYACGLCASDHVYAYSKTFACAHCTFQTCRKMYLKMVQHPGYNLRCPTCDKSNSILEMPFFGLRMVAEAVTKDVKKKGGADEEKVKKLKEYETRVKLLIEQLTRLEKENAELRKPKPFISPEEKFRAAEKEYLEYLKSDIEPFDINYIEVREQIAEPVVGEKRWDNNFPNPNLLQRKREAPIVLSDDENDEELQRAINISKASHKSERQRYRRATKRKESDEK